MNSSTARRRRRFVRLAAVAVGAALVLTGCGFGVQTLQQYTPAQGVNVDGGPVLVRNLLVIGDGAGAGVLSASIQSRENDRLVSVTGQALSANGDAAGDLTVTPATVELPANQLVVLTSAEQQVRVESPEMIVGGAVALELEFASGAVVATTAPVVSADHSIYATITPAPASPSPTATAASPASPVPGETTPGAQPPVESPTPAATP